MNIFRPAIVLTLVFVVLTGLLFPAAIWGIGQAAFPHQANGSLVKDANGKVIGSELIGQNFTDAKYFHPRPSAAGAGYDAANSSGTNLGPTSDKLINGIKDDPATKDADETYLGVKDLAAAYRKENGLSSNAKLPADAVTRSGSGLDPHISVENAMLQAERVARVNGMKLEDVEALIQQVKEGRFAGVYGEPRVNVLKLNLLLDRPSS
jgi:potassium-transporting ATPase KdpC subunit